MKPLTVEEIEQLKHTKDSCEENARLTGELQVRRLIEAEPDYNLLCTLYDFARAWQETGTADITCISNLDAFPESLHCFLIDGFYSGIMRLYDEFISATKEEIKSGLTPVEIGHAEAIDEFIRVLAEAEPTCQPIPFNTASAVLKAFDYSYSSWREIEALADMQIEGLKAEISILTSNNSCTA